MSRYGEHPDDRRRRRRGPDHVFYRDGRRPPGARSRDDERDRQRDLGRTHEAYRDAHRDYERGRRRVRHDYDEHPRRYGPSSAYNGDYDRLDDERRRRRRERDDRRGHRSTPRGPSQRGDDYRVDMRRAERRWRSGRENDPRGGYERRGYDQRPGPKGRTDDRIDRRGRVYHLPNGNVW